MFRNAIEGYSWYCEKIGKMYVIKWAVDSSFLILKLVKETSRRSRRSFSFCRLLERLAYTIGRRREGDEKGAL